MIFPVKEEDSTSLIEKERRQAAIKTKVLRLQKDLEKALQDKRGSYLLYLDLGYGFMCGEVISLQLILFFWEPLQRAKGYTNS